MPRRMILVRHGRTEDNAARRMISATNPPLDLFGREQAERVAETLSLIRVGAVFSSPRRRARETAEAIVRGRSEDLVLQLDERLAELGFGAFEGRTEEEIRREGAGDLFEAWRQGEPPHYPEGAETFEAAGERALSFFSSVLTEHSDVIVVGHGHQLRILLSVAILGTSARSHRRLRLDHGRIAVVEWEGQIPRLALLNALHFPTT